MTKLTSTRRRAFMAMIAAVYILTLLLPVSRMHTYASNIPIPDMIRVTLFIESRGTVPSVTLSGGAPLTIGARGPEGTKDWIVAPSGQAIRLSLNHYALRVIETTDYNAAAGAYQQIAALGQAEFYAVPGKGQTIYQVRLGGYRTAEEAASAKAIVPAAYSAGMAEPQIAGPHYASAGAYSSQDEALNRQTILAQNGVVSYVSVHPNQEGAIVYAVWLGEADSESALEKAKAAAIAAVPGLALQNVGPDTPYLLLRSDAASQSSGALTHYRFNPRNQNVRVSAPDSDITVSERYGRIYRGQIEATAYNGRLAVINELPFEQYLYSVVGSELDLSWPLEALKAQAVAARTFALKQGMKYSIAHISDTTYDQAYKGKGAEFAQAVEAVDATRSEVLTDRDGLILPYYSSNTGGLSADVSEAWTAPVAYVKSVESPDEIAQQGKPIWYRIMLPDGKSAYISSDYAVLSDQKNSAGLPYVEVRGEDINIRRAPYVDNTANAAIRQASTGERFVWIGQEIESNAYNWIRGPFTAGELVSTINARSTAPVGGALQTLEVSARGPSERVIGMKANGAELALANADAFRSAMNGLPSTRFEVEETGKYTVLGAAGRTQQFPSTAASLAVVANSGTAKPVSSEFYVMNGKGDVRVATASPAFRFVGLGNGHGVGLSQHGAKALAELGYDYQKILQYYYDGVSIAKE